MTVEMIPQMRFGDPRPVVSDEELMAGWHDVEEVGGKRFPVLWYDVVRYRGEYSVARTEPCIWCGRRHEHGALDGSRVPHCGHHTHDLTPTGRRRRVTAWGTPAAGATVCRHGTHRDYILRRRPEATR